MAERNGTIIFFDFESFSKKRDPGQREIAQPFFDQLKNILTGIWKSPPQRSGEGPYMILPTGDGAAIVLWKAANGSIEETAIYVVGKILKWGSSQNPIIGIRCGINNGVLDMVTDPYGNDNVCGGAINFAQRIMDAALPGQLLVAHDEVTRRLKPGTVEGLGLEYILLEEVHEILAKHDVIIEVKGITGKIIEGGKEYTFGKSDPPQEKWHLQIEPAKLRLDNYGNLIIKSPPVELLEKHSRIAFVGATNDLLATSISEVLNDPQINPTKRWQSITIFFLSNKALKWIETQGISYKQLKKDKKKAIKDIRTILNGHVDSLEFMEYDRPFYFASYWDWDEPKGRIHVSPYIWGKNIKECPGFDYIWKTTVPTKGYRFYKDGLENLRKISRPLKRLCIKF